MATGSRWSARIGICKTTKHNPDPSRKLMASMAPGPRDKALSRAAKFRTVPKRWRKRKRTLKRARWEGDTLIVDVSGFREETWFDRAGDYHSDQLHVVERYTPVSPFHLMYEATIEDPKVFTRPWKIHFPLYRHMEQDFQLLEFKCEPFTEEMLYGRFVKRPAP